LYGSIGYKWFTLKYSNAVSDFFGAPDSNGSDYIELNANFEVMDKTTLGFHVGHQKVKNVDNASYTDYKLSLARDFGFATIGLAVVGTDADKGFYSLTNAAGKTKKLGDTTAVLSISKAF
jgi:uncharacterized protein (TIGR02001 family)